MNNATLYINGQVVGCCELELPKPVVSTTHFAWNGSMAGRYTIFLKPKKSRRFNRQVRELGYSPATRALVNHYRRVKQHQLRKQLIRKRRHA